MTTLKHRVDFLDVCESREICDKISPIVTWKFVRQIEWSLDKPQLDDKKASKMILARRVINTYAS